MMFLIARRELRSLFLSPLAWMILAIVQLIMGFLFLSHVNIFLSVAPKLPLIPNAPGLTGLVAAPTLGNAAVLMLLIAPIMTMRVVAEERRNHTLTLLYTAPVSRLTIVLGKYLGVLSFFLIIVALILLMPLSLLAGGHLDFGMLACGALGLVLLVMTFAAVGVFMSTLTSHPTLAAISTFGILFLFWIIDWAGRGHGEGGAVVAYLSALNHYEPFLRGLFDTSALAYYLIVTAAFLGLGVRRLDADRVGA
ncbi:MAG: ABC transporter permease [Gammaproteobacteria bacterium]|nr:ABC transporter permease [Gammaproteobacteria bacterium]